MEIEVRLFATFREGRFKKKVFALAADTTLGEVITMVNLVHDEVSLPLVNGQYSPLDLKLKDGDVVSLFPQVGGG